MGGENLSDVADIIMGQSPPGNTVFSERRGLPLLNGPTEFGPHHPLPAQYTSDVRKHALHGDILFCVRGSTTGRMNWADQEYAIGRGVAAIRHKSWPELQPLIRAVIEDSLPSLLAQATGSTFPNVSSQQLSSIPFPDIPVNDQRAIAHILGALDDKIELNRKMNETLEAMARAIFKSWFVEFDPVRAKAEGRAPAGMDPETAALFPESFQDSEIGEVPRGWREGVINESIEILSGGTPKTSVTEYWDGNIPWYSVEDAPNDHDVFVIDTKRHIAAAGVESSATQILPMGTTIITARGTVGKLALTAVPMAMNQSCYGVRGTHGYPDLFTYYSLRKVVGDLQQQTHGTVFSTITRQTFTTVKALVPPVTQAQAFDRSVEPLLNRISANLFESRTLAAIRDALLPKLLSGEIRVGAAEKFAEAPA